MFKIGDILAFEGRGLISDTIGYFTGSNITHVAIILGEDYLLETKIFNITKVVKIADKINNYNGNIYLYKLNERGSNIINSDLDIFYKCILSSLNRKYDIKLIFKFIFARFLPVKWGENLDRFICSELVGYIFDYMGVIDSSINVSKLTPRSIIDLGIYEDVIQIK